METDDLIRKRVRYLADLRGMTLTELAQELQVSYPVLQHFLRGRYVLDVHELRKRIPKIVKADPWAEGTQEHGASH